MSNKKRLSLGWLLAIPFILMAVGAIFADDDQSRRLFLPVAVGGKQAPVQPTQCDIPNTHYSTLPIAGPPLKYDPETDISLNLGYRGYEKNNADRKLVVLGVVHDEKAPQFPSLFADNRVPTFTNTYQRYRWDDNGPIDAYSRWDTTVLGMGVTPGEIIHAPNTVHHIGGGFGYMVMYAAETRITLHIGREDDFHGYVLYIEDVCVDPDLLALYRKSQAAGRYDMPVLRNHQPFGKAIGSEIKIAVRDSGSFMDPRSRNDWWQGR